MQDQMLDEELKTEINAESYERESPTLLLEDNEVYLLSIDYAKDKFYARASNKIEIKKNEFVIVMTKYGIDIARVCNKVNNEQKQKFQDVVEIIRLATEEDIEKEKNNKKLEEEAENVFRKKVKDNNLNMKFIASHFLLGEEKVLFFFSADGRVDFRLLVRDLVAVFKMRVELRQISGREESRFIGGIAPCGREFCCHSINSNKLESVSIKMAKEQGLSLNSNRISGHCGRLLCCLAYENQYYAEINQTLPANGVKLNYDSKIFRVVDANRITEMISLIDDEGHTISIPLSRIKKINDAWTII